MSCVIYLSAGESPGAGEGSGAEGGASPCDSCHDNVAVQTTRGEAAGGGRRQGDVTTAT